MVFSSRSHRVLLLLFLSLSGIASGRSAYRKRKMARALAASQMKALVTTQVQLPVPTIPQASTNHNDNDPHVVTQQIRVLLAESTQPVIWELASEKGFCITNNARQLFESAAQHMTIEVSRNGVTINGKKVSNGISIVAKNKNITFNDKIFQGSFSVISKDTKAFLINSLDIETYVASVLHSESWPTWPLEAHKLCAVTCRTYAVHMALKARRNKAPFDIRNTNAHQTYRGMHTNAVMKEAVEQTKGILIGHENKHEAA